MADDLKRRSIKGVAWAASESFGVAAISLVSFIVLARILTPQDFGVVALATVFIFFCNIVTGHGFADAIVQRRRLEPEHLDTAFWSTLGIAILLMLACLAGAGPLAALLDEPQLAEVLRWLSLVLPLSAISAVQLALFRREMLFRAVAVRMLAGRGAGAAVGVSMALGGFGMWSLVGQQLAGAFIVAVVTLATARLRPRLRFSTQRLREMWTFGFHVSAGQVVTGATQQTLNLLIGALFGSIALGYFNIAWRMAHLVWSLISSAVYHVGLSAFSRLQEDRAAVSQAFLQSTRISCLVGFPIGAGMALVAGPMIVVLFGERWSASAPLLTVLALQMIPLFYAAFFSTLYRALDRAAWHLGMSLLNFAIGVAGVLAFAPFGLLAVIGFWVARAVLLIPIYVFLTHRLLALPVARVLSPVLVPLLATAAMAVGVLMLRFVPGFVEVGPIGRLALLVPAGALIYGAAIWILSPELVRTAMRTARVMVTPLQEPR